jgi:uncharacterized protein (TIGR02145 family)
LKNTFTLFLFVLFVRFSAIFSQTVTIGNQVWMTTNLSVDKFRNGDPIPEAQNDDEWTKADENRQPAWCYYENKAANGITYGKLYNWYAVNDPRGLAPEGFHVPSDDEWTTLEEFLGDAAGKKMKSKNGWDYDGIETNSSGFSGLPGGLRYYFGAFELIGNFGYWWSTKEYYIGCAYYRILSSGFDNLSRSFNSKGNGLSVRCLRD